MSNQVYFQYFSCTYNHAPVSDRTQHGGSWVSMIIRHDGNDKNFIQKVDRELYSWKSNRVPKYKTVIWSTHNAPCDGQQQLEHVHLLYYSYRGCAASASLQEILQRHPEWTWSWKRANCFTCARYYIRVGRGDKRVLYPVQGRCHPIDDILGLSDRECPHHGASEEGLQQAEAHCREEFTDNTGTVYQTEGGAVRDSILQPKINKTTVAQERYLEQMKEVRQFLTDHAISSFDDYEQRIVDTRDDNVLDNHTIQMRNKDYIRYINTQITLVQKGFRYMPWSELLNMLSPANLPINIDFMTVQDSFDFYHYWCEVQNIDPAQFMVDIANIMDRKESKFNMIYLQGDVNAFKSKICVSLLRSALFGVTICNVNQQTARFAWAPLLSARVGYWDECWVEPMWSEDTKSILGGEPKNVDVKNESQQRLERIPLLLSGNNPMWNGMPTERRDVYRQAICARGRYVKCNSVPGGENVKGDIHPRVWKHLYDKYVVSEFGSIPLSSGIVDTYQQKKRYSDNLKRSARKRPRNFFAYNGRSTLPSTSNDSNITSGNYVPVCDNDGADRHGSTDERDTTVHGLHASSTAGYTQAELEAVLGGSESLAWVFNEPWDQSNV